jgi:cellulose synthase/poly-beta-1,6-N-acetylglucosamine synthase-like glycosyltransferase
MATYSSIILYISLFFGLYYQIFILVTFFETDSKKSTVKKASLRSPHLPSVSIIVPCFNEEKTLEKTVLSLLGLNYPKEKLFITIVDDGSKDSTYKKAIEMTKYPNVRAFTQKNGGKFTALNFGIRNSNTEIIGCLDADSTVHPDSLLKMIPYFKGKDVVAVTPAMKVHNANTILQKMQRVEYNIGIFLKKIMGKLDAIHVTPGPFSLFKKNVFEKIGYFRHAHNTEDMEIAFRIQNNYYRIANCPTAFVYTITPSTFKKLYKQRTRWTYGFIKNALDYRHMFLNPRYGNLGMLTLPFAVISSIVALLLFSSTIYNFGSYLITHIQKYITIGFSLHLGSLDPFFFNTNTIVILAVIMFSISIGLILLSWRLAEGKIRIGRDILYFITLYGFIAPFWLAKASFNVLASRTTPWR